MSNSSIRGDPSRRSGPVGIARPIPGALGLGQHGSITDPVGSGSNRSVRPRSGTGTASGAASTVDNDRILPILMNLIETLSDDSINPTRTHLNRIGSRHTSSSITQILVRSMSASAAALLEEQAADSLTLNVPLPLLDTSITPISGLNSALSGLTAPPAWHYSTPPLSNLSRQNSINSQNSQYSGTYGHTNTQHHQEDDMLKQGEVFFSPLMKVDSAAIMCSAALCNLSEVPQCRPGLVSSGALKMIKAWLEIGIEVLVQARVLCFNKLSFPKSHLHRTQSNNSETIYSNSTEESDHSVLVKESCLAFMEAFSPAYELISNAAAALMHLSGGHDCRYLPTSTSPRSSHGAGAAHLLHSSGGTGGRDYMIGWIDAQILAEGLPAVVSSLYLGFIAVLYIILWVLLIFVYSVVGFISS